MSSEIEREGMSLSRSPGLLVVAKKVARELRRRQTNGERIFWQEVRNRKFLGKKFLRQHQILVDYLGRETFFVADFYCAESKLIVEIDGKSHQNQRDRDAIRTSAINDRGRKVIRFRDEEVENNLTRVLEELKKHL